MCCGEADGTLTGCRKQPLRSSDPSLTGAVLSAAEPRLKGAVGPPIAERAIEAIPQSASPLQSLANGLLEHGLIADAGPFGDLLRLFEVGDRDANRDGAVAFRFACSMRRSSTFGSVFLIFDPVERIIVPSLSARAGSHCVCRRPCGVACQSASSASDLNLGTSVNLRGILAPLRSVYFRIAREGPWR